MKTQKYQLSQIQNQIESIPTTMTEYLTIIRNFILEMHQKVNEQFEPEILPLNLTSIIDKAAIKLKTNKEQLSILEKENRDLSNNKILVAELKAEQSHMQKRFSQKNDQIEILRETVKTLYSDNERMNTQRQKTSKELVTSKQLTTQLKKKLKKQNQEMTNHKHELENLTKIAEEKLGQYATEDKEKQKSIKKLTQENEKLKNQIERGNIKIQDQKRQIEDFLKIKAEHQFNLKLIDTLKHENQLLKNKHQTLLQTFQQKTKSHSQELSSIKGELSNQTQKNVNLSFSLKESEIFKQNALIKIKSYEEDIMIRTAKLKQKNEQILKYDEQITKLVERIQSFSQMSNQIMKQNQILRQRCEFLEQRLEQGRLVQEYIQKIKGQINYSKSLELGKLIEALGSIRGKI